MKSGLSLYFHVHQPYRIRQYSVFDIGQNHDYFSQSDTSQLNNRLIFERVADKSYIPMTDLLLRLLNKHSEFSFSLSITGSFLDQAEAFSPEVIQQFKKLTETGRVEILGETYNHSLAFFYSRREFEEQVRLHKEKVKSLFGVSTTSFRNTELAYNDDLALWAEQAGYKAIIAEGWDTSLGWRSPNFTYRPEGTDKISLHLKNYRLSDDIAFRFGDRAWKSWPLTAEKYIDWINASLRDSPLLNLFMDFETFGEHQWSDTGIFTFFEKFINTWSQKENSCFYTISEAARNLTPVANLSMPQTTTWADSERDLSAWLGNSMQQEAVKILYDLEKDVLRTNDQKLIQDWRHLQSSDHLYYMATKWLSDNDIHVYFSPYESPYDAFLAFMNAMRDVRWRVMQHHGLDRFQ